MAKKDKFHVNIKFPKRFLWGTATSAYQVEGCIENNDWHEWETSKERVDELNRKGLSAEDFINKKNCDHYFSYEKDLDFARKLGNNAYRFSIEWARIEPEKGKFNEKEIEHYRKVIKALRRRKLEPFLTCYHFTLPAWLSREGGWLSKNAPAYFEAYARKLSESFSDITFWITINEPMVLAYKSYLQGEWPPQESSIPKALKVVKNLIEAHKRAYKIIHEHSAREAGIAHSMIDFQGLLWIYDYIYNFYFLDRIKDYQDFIGLNYYARKRIPKTKKIERSDMGWAIWPKGIYHSLKRLAGYRKQVYITENGIADYTDSKRGRYILEHLKNVHKALKEKVDVRGYFYWSLLDNFEWDSGFTKKFGLVEVDYKTLKRKPRKSFFLYKEICRHNGITKSMQKKFLK